MTTLKPFCRCIENCDIQELKKILERENMKEQTLSSGLVLALETYSSSNSRDIIDIINLLITYVFVKIIIIKKFIHVFQNRIFDLNFFNY